MPEPINLTEDGGIQKTILKEGDSANPPKGSKVTVHYVGKLLDGTVFDSSRDRGKEFEFTLGVGQVIKGWDVGVASMQIGELALLRCEAAYAYGENGSPPKIPGGATLEFEVELFEWEEGEEEDAMAGMSTAEKMEKAEALKVEGNGFFKEGKTPQALKKYSKASTILDSIFNAADEVSSDSDDGTPEKDALEKAEETGEEAATRVLKVACLLNAARCHTKNDDWAAVHGLTSKVLKMDAVNVKALFFRGQANSKMGGFEACETDLEAALALEPDNKAVQRELVIMKRAKAQQDKKEKAMYKGLFDKMAKMEAIPLSEQPPKAPEAPLEDSSDEEEAEAEEADAEAPAAEAEA